MNRSTGRLTPTSFYYMPLRFCWSAIKALWDEGSPINQVSVAYRLREQEQLGLVEVLREDEKVSYLSELVSKCESSVYIEHYAAKVQRCAVQRDLLEVLRAADNVLLDSGLETFEMAEKVSDMLFEVAPRPDGLKDEHTWKSGFDEAYAEANSSTAARFATGFLHTDEALGKGFARGRLVVLGAESGSGKTTLLSQWSQAWARQGYRVAFQSYEMTARELVQRAWIAETNIERDGIYAAFRNADDGVTERLMDVMGRESALPINVSQVPLDARGIEGWVRRLKRSQGVDVLVVDHIQELPAAPNAPTRALELAQACSRLKTLAMREDILVVVASQVNREPGGKPLTLARLRDSGGIGNGAENVAQDQRTKMNLSMPKNRGGPDSKDSVEFVKRFSRFVEWSE